MRQVISQAKNGRENEVTGRRDFLIGSFAAAGLAGGKPWTGYKSTHDGNWFMNLF